MIKIRRAGADDLPGIMQIESTCLQKGECFSYRRMRYLVLDAVGASFVAVHNNGVAGYVNLLFRKQQRGTKSIRIYNIAVSEDCRGNGIGQQLLDCVKQYALSMKIGRITLEVRTDNKQAVSLYSKNGFKTVRNLPNYYGNGINGYKMELVKF